MTKLKKILKVKKISRLISLIRKKIFNANSKKITLGLPANLQISTEIQQLKNALRESNFEGESNLSQELLIKKIIIPAFKLQVKP